jgi:hypothetical protein
MIPRGSQKPGYTERLKYAFNDEKKIKQQQEKLKQVQHMIMFMTTCWMYQLPSMQQKEPAASSAGQIPMGSFSGFMQQLPLEINIKDPNASDAQSLGYEATLTLKPVESKTFLQPEQEKLRTHLGSRGDRRGRGSAKHSEYSRDIGDRSMSKYEKQALENMRRSPYFSTKLLSQPFVVQRYSTSIGSVERERTKLEETIIIEEGKMKRVKEERSGGDDAQHNQPVTREQAAAGVNNILSEVDFLLLFRFNTLTYISSVVLR